MAILKLFALAVVVGLVVAAAPQAPDALFVRMPSMPEWKLLKKVTPEYPSAALKYRIQGTVRFNAIIGKDGHMEQLHLVSGHPLLAPAAREAAQQWIYGPTVLGGKPVRVITNIEVYFELDPYGNPVKEPNALPHRTEVL